MSDLKNLPSGAEPSTASSPCNDGADGSETDRLAALRRYDVAGPNEGLDALAMGELEQRRADAARREAEATLRKSEQRHRALVEGGADVVTIHDRDGIVRYQSPSLKRVLGYAPEEMEGENVFEYVHPDDRERARAELQRLFDESLPVNDAQFRMRHADGSWIHLEAVARNLLDDPAVEGVVVNSRDVTEREEAEAALRERVDLEETMVRVSRELLSTAPNLDAVTEMLGKAVRADRAYVVRVGDGREGPREIHKWSLPGAGLEVEQAPDFDDFAWWNEQIRRRKALSVIVSELPPEARAEQRFFEEVGVESYLNVPIRLSDGAFHGFIGFDDATEARAWSEKDARLLRVVSDLLAGHFERSETEETLRRSEEQFRRIAETITQVFWVVDLDEGFRYISPAFEDVWDRPREDLYENPRLWYEMLHPDDRERVKENFRSGAEAYDTEYRIVRPDGEVRWVRGRGYPARKAEGKRLLIGVSEDITERKQTEMELRHSEKRHRALVSRASDVMLILEADGTVRYASPSLKRVLGHDPAALEGNDIFETIHYDDQARVRAKYEDLLEQPGETAWAQYRVLHADGSWVHFESLTRNLMEDPAIRGAVVNSRDVTDSRRVEAERQARERAEELLKAKSNFLNNMSHELRTPLASIIGFADVLSDEGEGEQQTFAERIAESGKRLQDTLDSILSLAQFEGRGAEDMALERTPVTEEVRRATVAHRFAAEEKNLSFDVRAPEGEIYASLDEGAFQRVLDNLIGNAVKFTEEGGVTVRVEPDEHEVRICVADTGIGIGEDFREKLFDDFTQESTGLNRLHEGSGLGLAIVQRLTELMDGTIGVESVRGEGTVFTVSFPRAARREDPGAEADGRSSDDVPEPTPDTEVLVVEDNPNTRMLVEHQLRKRYDVESARDGESLELNRKKRFDAFLIDINLGPNEDGVELLHRLRATPSGESVPAVAFTAHAMPGDEERFRNAGFDGYLAKPFSKQELLEAIESILPLRSSKEAIAKSRPARAS